MTKEAEPNAIEGLKLIRHNTGGVSESRDPSYPFTLEANFRPPEFMQFAFVALCGGSEEVVVQGKTEGALRKFIIVNDFLNHPRLRSLTIEDPEGILFQHPKPQISPQR